MPWLSSVTAHLYRALCLLGLTVAPTTLSPDPLLADDALAPRLAAAIVLVLLLWGASRLRIWLHSAESRFAAVLIWFAVATSLGCALYFTGDNAPLARGVPFLALPVWSAIGATAAALAGSFLGSSFKHKRTAAAVVVLAIGFAQLQDAAKLLGSHDAMWAEALKRDGGHSRALTALATPMLRAKKLDQAAKLADKCLKLHPESCACLALRAEVSVRLHQGPGALAEARAAVDQCPDDAAAKSALVQALSDNGDGEGALKEARAAIDAGGDSDGRLHLALATALNQAGEYDKALEEAKKAAELGAGRDAELLAGALAIVANQLDEAKKWLDPLVKSNPNDAEALYDLALIADKKGDYNGARQGYLATLKADPSFANARFNLVQLTWRQGVREEARHHAERFNESWPDDPRGASLLQLTATAEKP